LEQKDRYAGNSNARKWLCFHVLILTGTSYDSSTKIIDAIALLVVLSTSNRPVVATGLPATPTQCEGRWPVPSRQLTRCTAHRAVAASHARKI
jgi:hypothetical protein